MSFILNTDKMNTEEKKARRYLDDIGLKEGRSGYTYLLEIILFQLFNPSPILKSAIWHVSDKYGVSYRNVQNSIQYALKDLRQAGCELECKQIVIGCINYIRTTGDSNYEEV